MAESQTWTVDALIPAEMALRAEKVGVSKATMSHFTLFALGVLAGTFIALGAIFATTVPVPTMSIDPASGEPLAEWLPFGLLKLLGGFTFCLGLILVVVAGAELFTGNNLIIMAWANGKISTANLLRNWGIVFLGNFVGAILTVVVVLLSGQHIFGDGAVGLNALNIAQAKVGYGFIQAIFLGSLCNMLVCLAVWLVFSARTTTDKILSIILPITAFVAAGFEHSTANMLHSDGISDETVCRGFLLERHRPNGCGLCRIDLRKLPVTQSAAGADRQYHRWRCGRGGCLLRYLFTAQSY
jgi:formate/nitrite transporter